MLVLDMQDGYRLKDPSGSEICHALRRLNGGTCTFAYLETEEGSYIQVGGGPAEFTIEVRLSQANGSFTHWKAVRPGVKESNALRYLNIGGQAVSVQEHEVLPFATVCQVFEQFSGDARLSEVVGWRDITNWFSGVQETPK